MSKDSFAQTTNKAKTMLAGLTNNATAVAKRGIDQDFVNRMQKTLAIINELDNEQERLKAQLKTKSAELDSEINKLKELHSEAKKVVKLSIKQTSWREFGIEDTK